MKNEREQPVDASDCVEIFKSMEAISRIKKKGGRWLQITDYPTRMTPSSPTPPPPPPKKIKLNKHVHKKPSKQPSNIKSTLKEIYKA